MARTLSEIDTELDATITDAISNPSASSFAEWKLWKSIFKTAIWTFEKILDAFKIEIETLIERKQPGTFSWYYDKIMEFQGSNDNGGNFQGDTLVITDGVVTYQTPDESRRLIKSASLSANNGVLAIKVAKALTDTTYQQLDTDEQLALGLYLDNVKFPGTQVNVISLPADLISPSIKVVYDPIYTISNLTTSINAKLEEFRTGLGFDDKVYPFQILDKIKEIFGVIAVEFTSITAGGYSTSWTMDPITTVYVLESGYFNFDDVTIDLVNYKTL